MKVTRSIVVVLFLFSFSPEILFAQPPEIYAGFAQIDITPPDGYSHYRGVSTGVHDPLYAKSVVWGKGDNRFSLVVCDLLWIERELSTRVRLLVSQEIQIPSSNVIIAGTHSHTSPAYHLNIQELNSGLRPTSYIPPKTSAGDTYPEWLAKAIAQAIIEADKASTRVNIHTGTGTVEDLAFNRRFILADGTVRFKEASPFKTTLVIELTNSHIAYVPTEKAFRQGSYETINSRVAPGGGELMVKAAIKLLNEIKKNEAQ